MKTETKYVIMGGLWGFLGSLTFLANMGANYQTQLLNTLYALNATILMMGCFILAELRRGQNKENV